jgi:ribosomal protein S18 acetylase RimI-like enzyme
VSNDQSARGDAVRVAGKADAEEVGRLLHDFQTEYAEETPGPVAIAERIRGLIGTEETVVLLAGSPNAEGVAVLRLRPSIYRPALECYLAELYVAPDSRGHGLGRALMEAAMEEAGRRGADYMDLGTSEADVAARGLYESLGFSNRERGADGPISYFYERDL